MSRNSTLNIATQLFWSRFARSAIAKHCEDLSCLFAARPEPDGEQHVT
jgi:hypothetical protein